MAHNVAVCVETGLLKAACRGCWWKKPASFPKLLLRRVKLSADVYKRWGSFSVVVPNMSHLSTHPNRVALSVVFLRIYVLHNLPSKIADNDVSGFLSHVGRRWLLGNKKKIKKNQLFPVDEFPVIHLFPIPGQDGDCDPVCSIILFCIKFKFI